MHRAFVGDLEQPNALLFAAAAPRSPTLDEKLVLANSPSLEVYTILSLPRAKTNLVV